MDSLKTICLLLEVQKDLRISNFMKAIFLFNLVWMLQGRKKLRIYFVASSPQVNIAKLSIDPFKMCMCLNWQKPNSLVNYKNIYLQYIPKTSTCKRICFHLISASNSKEQIKYQNESYSFYLNWFPYERQCLH